MTGSRVQGESLPTWAAREIKMHEGCVPCVEMQTASWSDPWADLKNHDARRQHFEEAVAHHTRLVLKVEVKVQGSCGVVPAGRGAKRLLEQSCWQAEHTSGA